MFQGTDPTADLITWAFIIGFFIMLFIAALITRRWIHSASEFFQSGREISKWIIGFGWPTMVIGPTWFSVGLLVMLISGSWTSVWLLATWSISTMITGFFFIRWLRRSGCYTVSEWLEVRFNKGTRTFFSIAWPIGMVLAMGSHTIAMCVIMEISMGLPFWISGAIILGVTAVYLILGGLWSVTVTDFIQLWVIIFAMLVGVLYFMSQVPLETVMASPAISGAFPNGLAELGILFPGLMALICMWFFFMPADPATTIRGTSARDEKNCAWGFVIAGVIVILVMSVLVPIMGFYVWNNHLADVIADPSLMIGGAGFAVLDLPGVLGDILLIGMLAAIITTVASSVIAVSSVWTRDIYQRWFKPKANVRELLLPGRILIIVAMVVIYVVVLSGADLVDLITVCFASWEPFGIALMGAFLWKRVTPAAALWTSIIGFLATFVWWLYPVPDVFPAFGPPQVGLQNQVMSVNVFSAILGVVLLIVITLVTKPKYYGARSWKAAKPAPGYGGVSYSDKQNASKSSFKLTKMDTDILEILREKHSRFADVIDHFGLEGALLNERVELLEQNGFVTRPGYKYGNLHTLYPTAQGLAALPKMSSKEESVLHDNLSIKDLKVLNFISKKPGSIAEDIHDKLKISGTEVIPRVTHLSDEGLINQKGIFRRKAVVTKKGQSILKKHVNLLK